MKHSTANAVSHALLFAAIVVAVSCLASEVIGAIHYAHSKPRERSVDKEAIWAIESFERNSSPTPERDSFDDALWMNTFVIQPSMDISK